MSKTVATEELKPGMVLAKSVENRNFQTLLPGGIKLNDNYISILKKWEILSVSIMQEEEEKSEHTRASKAKGKSPAAIRLSQRLLWDPENDFENEIYKMALKKSAKVIISQDFD